MKNPLPSLFLLLTCTLLAPLAQAEKADRNKPMNVEADTLRYDDVKQVSIFTGNVVLTKGTIVIRAARIDVRQDPDGYQFGTITGTPDKLAFFRQKREALDEFIEGESELIEYDGRADVVKFVRKALLRRLRGATLADEIAGGLIVYENLTDTFSVDGNAVKGAAATPGQRVRAVLTPKSEGAAATPAAPVASGAGASLRATTTLGGAPK
ncbi:MAG: lipopolysaccharide transport periplasmic protein LptA [Burkholderiales bacterium]|nr:lipopolysaccharide transport periplasmic protein LptA [Burkholderiales bacterium]